MGVKKITWVRARGGPVKGLPRITFETEPADGFAIAIDGQRYEAIGVVEHVRLDGEPTRLVIWQSRCAECGARFEFKTSAHSLPQNRRCDEHRRPGVKVDPERRRRIANAAEGKL